MKHANWFLPILFVSLGVASAYAQFETGIQGLVRDPSGAEIAGVTVTLRNVDTGATRTATTSEAGFYRFPSLPGGTYEVRAALAGFKTAVKRAIRVSATELRREDVALEVGALAEEVIVEARPLAVETEEGRVSGVLEARKIQELPLRGRSVYSLLALQPGVIGKNVAPDALSFAPAPVINSSGQRTDANNFQLDSTQINDAPFGGGAIFTPTFESVSEVRIISNNMSAEWGRNSGTLINVVSKSGTNEFHGSAFYYYLGDELAARNVFEQEVGEFTKQEFGGSLGGPVWKDHTFFFATFHGVEEKTAGRTFRGTVETPEFRDFVLRTRPDSLAAFFLSTFPARALPDPSTYLDLGSPAPGPLQIGPPDGIPDVGTALINLPGRRNAQQYQFRIDHEFAGGRDRLYANFYGTNYDTPVPEVRAAFDGHDPVSDRYAGVNWTHIFSPTTLNEFKVGYTRFRGAPQRTHFEVPEIGITGSLGFGAWGGFPASWAQNNFEWKEALTLIRGRHSLKVGATLRYGQDDGSLPFFVRPQYTFDSILDFADDEPFRELRAVDPATGEPVANVRAFRTVEWGAYVQDDWKVRPNLTLNLGLRYENYGTPGEADGELANFVPGQGTSFFERIASGRMDRVSRLFEPDHDNFAPRMGFAWDATGRGRLAVRGGFGVSQNRIMNTNWTDNRFQPPLYAEVASGVFQGTPVIYNLGDVTRPNFGFPPNPSLSVGLDERNGIRGSRVFLRGVIDPNIRSSNSYNWFLGAQYQLFANAVVEANYLGNAGRGLTVQEEVNRFPGDLLDGRLDRLNPSFDGIVYSRSRGRSRYHGATFAVRKSFSDGWSVSGHYTVGKATDEASFGRGEIGTVDVTRPELERGRAGFDVRHQVAFAWLWELPFLRGGQGRLARLLGGWEINGIAIVQSGTPFSVITTRAFSPGPDGKPLGDFNADGDNFDRPDTPDFGARLPDRSQQGFLDGVFQVSDFPLPEAGTNGTLGRNVFEGPGYLSVDLAVLKNFPIPWFWGSEGAKLQIRGEFLNAFNRVNLMNPVSDLADPLFGKSTSTFPTREVQLAVKLLF